MDFFNLSRQKVKSQSTAQQELELWLRVNRNDITDEDGQPWRVKIFDKLEFIADGSQKLRTYFQAENAFTAKDVLNDEGDQRLLSLLEGEGGFIIKLKPTAFKSTQIDGLKLELAQEILRLKEKIKVQSFDTKRREMIIARVENLGSAMMQTVLDSLK
jgi:hypothetical protein